MHVHQFLHITNDVLHVVCCSASPVTRLQLLLGLPGSAFVTRGAEEAQVPVMESFCQGLPLLQDLAVDGSSRNAGGFGDRVLSAVRHSTLCNDVPALTAAHISATAVAVKWHGFYSARCVSEASSCVASQVVPGKGARTTSTLPHR
jgi:hypothetical protein